MIDATMDPRRPYRRGRAFALRAGIVAVLVAAASLSAPSAVPPASASQIVAVVNNVPVTTYDVQRRAAFLKLQRKGGGSAKEDMVDQTLRSVEMQRLKINVPKKQIDDAYARFASGNKLSTTQLDTILNQSGVTRDHFREFIRVQIGWNQALGARFRAEGRMSETDVVQRMLKDGGNKPRATEYMLQQVIFVVPAKERGKLPVRKKEAEAMRARFTGCETTREFAKGLIDVTVRDLGRVLEPELPPDWAPQIKSTSQGKATSVRETDRGVEFIGICSSREVSDDRVAQMVFQNEGAPNEKADELNKKYMDDLRKQGRIVNR